MQRSLAFLFLALLLAANGIASSLEIIELHHRPAAELIPIVKPMLDDSGSISGQGFQLFVRTSPDNLAQLRKMIEQLDSAPEQLLVSVVQGSERDLRALALDGAVAYRDDNVDLSIGRPTTSGSGASAGISTRDGTISGNALSTRGRLSETPVHRLRLTSGVPGYIETGQSIPYFSGVVWTRRHRGDVAGAGVEYKDTHTGFYVLPRVSGDRVIMEISPYKEALNASRGGVIDTQSAATRISGALGQWIEIGGVSEQVSRSGSGVASYGSTHSRNNSSIWIRADKID